jgi:hypothetical protein
MPVLVDAHEGELFGAGRVVCAEAFGEISVDTGVLLLEGDGQGKDFSLAKALERSQPDLLVSEEGPSLSLQADVV